MAAELLRSWQYPTCSTAQTEVQETEENRSYPEIKTEGKIAISIDAVTQLNTYAPLVFI